MVMRPTFGVCVYIRCCVLCMILPICNDMLYVLHDVTSCVLVKCSPSLWFAFTRYYIVMFDVADVYCAVFLYVRVHGIICVAVTMIVLFMYSCDHCVAVIMIVLLMYSCDHCVAVTMIVLLMYSCDHCVAETMIVRLMYSCDHCVQRVFIPNRQNQWQYKVQHLLLFPRLCGCVVMFIFMLPTGNPFLLLL
jgi:hypothetical protein